jgi:hypothetical protein
MLIEKPPFSGHPVEDETMRDLTHARKDVMEPHHLARQLLFVFFFAIKNARVAKHTGAWLIRTGVEG